MTALIIRERELLDRLSYALLMGREIERARRALRQFYAAIGL